MKKHLRSSRKLANRFRTELARRRLLSGTPARAPRRQSEMLGATNFSYVHPLVDLTTC
jgi:hypothetical protein